MSTSTTTDGMLLLCTRLMKLLEDITILGGSVIPVAYRINERIIVGGSSYHENRSSIRISSMKCTTSAIKPALDSVGVEHIMPSNI